MLEFGSLFLRQHGFDEIGQEHLELLAATTGQTAALAFLSRNEIIHALVARSSRAVQHFTEVGQRSAAHSTALGKAILSMRRNEEVLEIIGSGELERFTPHTLGDSRAFLAELDRVRKQGYAVDNEETALGLRCVAVFVELPGMGPASNSVSGPAAEFRARAVPAFSRAVREAGNELVDVLQSTARFSLYPKRTAAPETP
jgi:IclR family acetate operon transcriptional repressor